MAQVSSVCLRFHPWSSACALVLECSLHPSLYLVLKSFFHLFLNPAMVPDENSMEDLLCNSSFGSMVSLDYVTPDTVVPAAATESVVQAATTESVVPGVTGFCDCCTKCVDLDWDSSSGSDGACYTYVQQPRAACTFWFRAAPRHRRLRTAGCR